MENRNTAKTVFLVTAVTVLSRFMSLFSVQLYMSYYGANDPALLIYDYALNAPNIIFTCIGTLLTTVVVPTYSAMLDKNETRRGAKFLNDMVSISSLLIFCLVAICFILAPVFFRTYSAEPDKLAYAVFCLRVLLPVMFFYGLNFIFQGILQSHGKFLLPAAVTIPSSLIVVLYVALFGGRFGVTGLVYATLIGLSLQALFLMPAVFKTGYRYRPSFGFKDPEIVRCAKLAPPVLIAVSAYQINQLFNLTMALSLGKNVIMGYVQRIILVSVLSLVYSLTSVYYPKLSVLWSKGDCSSYKDTISQVINVVTFFLVPATVGFILMRYQLFDLISRWGKVTAEDVRLAGNILALYSLGIVPLGFKEVLDRAFYAQQNTKVSAVFGFVIMGVNVSMSLMLIPLLGVYALPLSYSVSSAAGVFGLALVLRKSIAGFNRDIFVTAAKSLLAALVMGAVILLENRLLSACAGEGLPGRSVKLFIPVTTGVAVYFAAAYLLGMSQIREVMRKIRGA